MSNRVLEDPRQRRLFQSSDLAELFNLNESLDGKTTESDRIFHDCKLKPGELNFSASKVEAMRKLASSVSKRIEEIAKNDGKKTPTTDTPVVEEPQRQKRLKKHRKKRKKRDEKPEVAAIFEGEKVPCLIGRRLGRSTPSEEEQVSSTCDDQYVLMKLFAKTSKSNLHNFT